MEPFEVEKAQMLRLLLLHSDGGDVLECNSKIFKYCCSPTLMIYKSELSIKGRSTNSFVVAMMKS